MNIEGGHDIVWANVWSRLVQKSMKKLKDNCSTKAMIFHMCARMTELNDRLKWRLSERAVRFFVLYM